MAKRQAAAKPGATKAKCLPAKKRKLIFKLLVAEIHKDISAKALEALWKLQHFNEHPIPDMFRELFLKNSSVGLVNFELNVLLRRYLMTMTLSHYSMPFFLKRF